jgi:hypothetical protein
MGGVIRLIRPYYSPVLPLEISVLFPLLNHFRFRGPRAWVDRRETALAHENQSWAIRLSGPLLNCMIVLCAGCADVRCPGIGDSPEKLRSLSLPEPTIRLDSR